MVGFSFAEVSAISNEFQRLLYRSIKEQMKRLNNINPNQLRRNARADKLRHLSGGDNFYRGRYGIDARKKN